MHTAPRRLLLVLTFTLAMTSLPAGAQVAVSTVQVGVTPYTEAVNPVTNTLFVANYCGNDPNCASPGTMTIMNGSTLATQTIPVGDLPYSVAVNSVTNKAYVTTCGNDLTCSSNNGTLTAIDGVTLSARSVNIGVNPVFVALNSVTNKIYVVVLPCSGSAPCSTNGTVAIVDGNTFVTQIVNVGYEPYSLAVNSVTNKIYVVNECGADPSCNSAGSVTVIDGATLAAQTVNVGYYPLYAAVNPVTNTIYVANNGGNDDSDNGTVTVIDGSTLSTQTVPVGIFPAAVAVNATTNKIYIGNRCGSDPNCIDKPSASVIDGNNLSNVSTVTICSVDTYPADSIDLNPTTNMVYLPCLGRQEATGLTVTAIDGATNTTTPIAVGDYPYAAVVNPATNTIFVPNTGDNTVSVIGGATKLELVNVTPCRLVDTRKTGNTLQGGISQNFAIPQLGGCNIPASAVAYSLNVTVVPPGPLGYLTIWPAAEYQPVVSTMNSLDGRIKANAAIVPAGVNGTVSVYASNPTDLVLDIDGYFAPANGSSLQFYPLAPCRVVDTRNSNGPLDGPFLPARQERDFPVLQSSLHSTRRNSAGVLL